MLDPNFQSKFTATYAGKTYTVVTLIDYVNGVVSFQDKVYHPSQILTRPIDQVVITPTN